MRRRSARVTRCKMPPEALVISWDEAAHLARGSNRARAAGDRRSAARRKSACDGVPRPYGGVGGRDPARSRRRRHDRVRRRLPGAGRANDGGARRVRHVRRAGRPRGGSDAPHRCSSVPGSCRVGSAFRTRACSCSLKPTFSRKSGDARTAAPLATRKFLSDFRDLKVGDLVVHVDHGIGGSSG